MELAVTTLPDTLAESAEFVVIDTETTGKDDAAEVIEVAALRFKGERIIDRYVSLVRPTLPIHAAATAVHGLTADHVANAPPRAVVLAWLRDFVRPNDVLVAHFAHFDAGKLPGLRNNQWICTWRLARHLWPHSPCGYSNGALAAWLRLDLRHPQRDGRPHRAEYDATLTGALFERLLRAYQGIQPYATLQDVMDLARSPIPVTIFSYGKKWHGMPITAIDSDYIRWVLEDAAKPTQERIMRVDSDTIGALQAEIRSRKQRAA